MDQWQEHKPSSGSAGAAQASRMEGQCRSRCGVLEVEWRQSLALTPTATDDHSSCPGRATHGPFLPAGHSALPFLAAFRG